MTFASDESTVCRPTGMPQTETLRLFRRLFILLFANLLAACPATGFAWVRTFPTEAAEVLLHYSPTAILVAGGTYENYGLGPAALDLRASDGTEIWRYWHPEAYSGIDSFSFSYGAIAPNGDVVLGATRAGIERHSGSDGGLVWATHGFGVPCPDVRYRYDALTDVAVLPDNDVVTIGYSLECAPIGQSYGFAVFRIDGASGAVVWKRILPDGSPSGLATSVVVAPDGNPIVAGQISFSPFPSRAYVTKLDAATGTTIWEHLNNASPLVNTALHIDSAGDVLFGTAGSMPGPDALTKLAGSTGAVRWTAHTSGGRDCCEDGIDRDRRLLDQLSTFALTPQGDVIVARQSVIETSECRGGTTIAWAKFDGATGSRIWDTLEGLVGGGLCPSTLARAAHITSMAIEPVSGDIVAAEVDDAGRFFKISRATATDPPVAQWVYANRLGHARKVIVASNGVFGAGDFVRPDGLKDEFAVVRLDLADGKGACGDRVVDSDEECDDGNLLNGDGCASDCRTEARCGDGNIDPGEDCDDGASPSSGGCRSDCHCDASAVSHTGSLIPAQQTKHEASALLTGERSVAFRFPAYPALGVYVHEVFIPMEEFDPEDNLASTVGISLAEAVSDLVLAFINSLATRFPGASVDTEIRGKGDGRSQDSNFSPDRTRAFLVLDFERGRGRLFVNHSDVKVRLLAKVLGQEVDSVDVTGAVPNKLKSFKARRVRRTWHGADSWAWVDWVNPDTFRIRYSLLNGAPFADVFSHTIDHQLLIHRVTGDVTSEGDTFPSTGTYRYRCSPVAHLVSVTNADDYSDLGQQQTFAWPAPVVGQQPVQR